MNELVKDILNLVTPVVERFWKEERTLPLVIAQDGEESDYVMNSILEGDETIEGKAYSVRLDYPLVENLGFNQHMIGKLTVYLCRTEDAEEYNRKRIISFDVTFDGKAVTPLLDTVDQNQKITKATLASIRQDITFTKLAR